MDHILSSAENEAYFPFGLAVHDNARSRLRLEDLITRSGGNLESRQLLFARLLVAAINKDPARPRQEARLARAGELLALMLLHEIYRYFIALYTRVRQPGVLSTGLFHIRQIFGNTPTENILEAVVDYYPPRVRYETALTPRDFLAGHTHNCPNVERILWELLILHTDHENPAATVFKPIFDNAALCDRVPLQAFMAEMERFLESQPPVPETNLTLLEMLREPIRACQDSLEGQSEVLMSRCGSLLPHKLRERWMITRGILREETIFRGTGTGPAHAYTFTGDDYAEPEAFTPDVDWMPNVVLLAKLAYVWLDQLSQKYGRHLVYLSDIPDAELDRMAQWGFNVLWLIAAYGQSGGCRLSLQPL